MPDTNWFQFAQLNMESAAKLYSLLLVFFVFTHVTSLCGQEKHSRIGFFLLNSTHLLLIVELLNLYSIIQSINQSIKLFVSDYNDP